MPFYVDAVIREWKAVQDSYSGPYAVETSLQAPYNTLYIGGGTPSLLPSSHIGKLVEMVARVAPLSEVTLEVNPSDVDMAIGHEWLSLGINRLSMGVQSFDDTCLKSLKRRHTAREAAQAYRWAQQAGFTNISLDVIFGFPGNTMAIWEETLRQLVLLRPQHVSAYQLSVEEGSAWGRLYEKGKLVLPSQEDCAAQYACLQEVLEKAGYLQYEISNFCLPGYASCHNSAYWQRVPYVGLGPAAHSFTGVYRYWNVPNTTSYMKRLQQGQLPKRESDVLSEEDVCNELIMLGLRTVQGLNLDRLATTCGQRNRDQLVEQAKPFLEAGTLAKTTRNGNTYLHIPAEHLFIADAITRDCLLLPEDPCKDLLQNGQ